MKKFESLNLDMLSYVQDVPETDQLQRTEEWLEKRKGRFTGSRISDLMSCGRSTAKQPWGSLEKIVDFGVAAERYIYNVGMERTTGLCSMEVSSKQMEHGKIHEPLLIKKILDDGLITDFEELGFEHFGDYENGGASVDGKCIYINEKVGLELKCCVSWDGHYKRMYEPVHDKHDDFWQFQAELLAIGTEKLLYVVTHPMTVEKYDYQLVEASKIHQNCMLQRCKIADNAIDLWPQYGYKKALEVACANYMEENN